MADLYPNIEMFVLTTNGLNIPIRDSTLKTMTQLYTAYNKLTSNRTWTIETKCKEKDIMQTLMKGN